MNKDNLKLIYVDTIGKNLTGNYEYDFYFSEAPDIVWGDDWNEQCPLACENLRPYTNTYSLVKRLVTDIPFFCAQKNSCFSMSDMTVGIIACCFEDISEYEEYPEPYRIVFGFGESYKSVVEKLNSRNVSFNEEDYEDVEKEN